jgi:hyperosmotically inducible protein
LAPSPKDNETLEQQVDGRISTAIQLILLASPLPFEQDVSGLLAGRAARQERTGGLGTMKVRRLFTLVALLVTISGSAFAQDRRDVRLADDIGRSILGYTRLTIFDDISATVENGAVVLSGKVTMPFKKGDIEHRVAKIDGVRAVRNDITVLPVSPYDDQLRYRVSRAIYNNPSFWNYASMANPPIHIIVEGGRVTLSGVVNSNVERMLAGSLAIGNGELSVKNELKTDAEIKSE